MSNPFFIWKLFHSEVESFLHDLVHTAMSVWVLLTIRPRDFVFIDGITTN